LDILEKYFDLEDLPSLISPLQGKAQGYPGHFAKVELQGGPLRRYSSSSNKRPLSSSLPMNQSEIAASLFSRHEQLSDFGTPSSDTTNVNVCSKVMAKGTFHPTDPENGIAIQLYSHDN
jgi:hypothetical protein